jgi:EmrB/QacA subfamily drug resistance transporter
MVAAQFMFVVDAFIVNVAIPSIRADLTATGSQIEAVVAVYQIAYATLLITGGRLGDIYGRKRLFLVGLLGFTAASLWCGIASSALTLIAARGAQGAAAALMVPQVLASIQSLFPTEERARAFGVFGIALGLGGAVGLMLGGWLVSLDFHGLGWRSAFLVNLPVGILTAAGATGLVPALETPTQARLDLPGVGILVTATLLILGPILFGQDLGWPWWGWSVLAIGFTVLAAFLQVENTIGQHGGDPLLNVAMLRDSALLVGLGATFSFYIGVTSFLLVLTLFLQNGLGFSALKAGLASGPLAIAFLISSRIGVRISMPKVPGMMMAGCGFLAIALACLAALVCVIPNPSILVLAGPLALYGFGQGLVMAPLVNTVLAKATRVPAGAASGVLITTQQIAGATGIGLIGSIYFAVRDAFHNGPDRMALLASIVALIAMACTAIWLLAQLRVEGAKL